MRNELNQVSAKDRLEQMHVSNQLSESLKMIFALSESYPDLKANENFKHLQEELSVIENKIAYSRQLYNSSVTSDNIKLQTFPSDLIAKMNGFKEIELLETPSEDRVVPNVTF